MNKTDHPKFNRRPKDPLEYMPAYYAMFRGSRDYGYKIGRGLQFDSVLWGDLDAAIQEKGWIPYCFMQKVVTSGGQDFVPARRLANSSFLQQFATWEDTCRNGGNEIELSGQKVVPSIRVMSLMNEKDKLRHAVARHPSLHIFRMIRDPALNFSFMFRVVSTPMEKWGDVSEEEWSVALSNLRKDPVLRAYIHSNYGLHSINEQAEKRGWEGVRPSAGISAHISDSADWCFG